MIEIKPLEFDTFDSFGGDENQESLQRTKEWFENRRGRFTGSKFKDLMSSGRSSGKLSWGTPTKLFDFGAKAERYIYRVGKERITGCLSMEINSKQLDHGKVHEPLLIEQLLSDGVIKHFEERGFEQFPDYENAGASVDGICEYEGVRVGLETKCCVSWDGHYNRMYESIHDKHDDFWQFQAEMKAVGVESLLYVVALPMTTKKYDVSLTHASKVHQEQMLHRCKIADLAISKWDELGYQQALVYANANYKVTS